MTPMSARSASVMLVTTVSASTRRRGKSRAAATAAATMAVPPMAWTVTRPWSRRRPAPSPTVPNRQPLTSAPIR